MFSILCLSRMVRYNFREQWETFQPTSFCGEFVASLSEYVIQDVFVYFTEIFSSIQRFLSFCDCSLLKLVEINFCSDFLFILKGKFLGFGLLKDHWRCYCKCASMLLYVPVSVCSHSVVEMSFACRCAVVSLMQTSSSFSIFFVLFFWAAATIKRAWNVPRGEQWQMSNHFVRNDAVIHCRGIAFMWLLKATTQHKRIASEINLLNYFRQRQKRRCCRSQSEIQCFKAFTSEGRKKKMEPKNFYSTYQTIFCCSSVSFALCAIPFLHFLVCVVCVSTC